MSPTTLLASGIGSLAGAVLVAANRSLLTAGVMVLMALVPSAAIVGIGLATGQLGLARQGFFLWLADVGLVIGGSLLVFIWKRLQVHQRKSLV